MHRLILVYTLVCANFCSYRDTSAAPQSASIKALRNSNLRRDGKRLRVIYLFIYYLFICLFVYKNHFFLVIALHLPPFPPPPSFIWTLVNALWWRGAGEEEGFGPVLSPARPPFSGMGLRGVRPVPEAIEWVRWLISLYPREVILVFSSHTRTTGLQKVAGCAAHRSSS